jgi:hypothetical protein
MCSGDGGAAQRAAQQQAKANRLAQQRQAELDRQAAAFRAQAASQQAEMERLRKAQEQAAQAQQANVADLEARRTAQMAEIAKTRDATNAAAASLRVLASQPETVAPTAQQAGPPRTAAGRVRRTRSELRMGATASGSGVGTNLGG